MRRRGVGLALALSVVVARPANAHPLHTTLTELSEDRARAVVRATIRVFADDFGTAIQRSSKGRVGATTGPEWDAATMAYLSAAFGFTDRAGHAVALHACGVRRTGDLLWICVEGTSAGGLASLEVWSAVLCDIFEDQVNVVQTTIAGARRSLLFVRGDGAKPLSKVQLGAAR
jgi:hypothetical protein